MASLYAAALFAAGLLPLQSSLPPSSRAPETVWSVATGQADLSLRDFAQSSIPLHTSPISLGTAGLAVIGGFERSTITRAHVVRVAILPARRLEFRGPAYSASAGDSDASSVRLRYECRWYPFRDVALDGLDAGVSGLALGTRSAIRRRVLPANDRRIVDLDGGAGVGANLRYRPGSRLRLQGGVSAVLVIGRTSDVHDVQADASSRWGGGWLLGGSVEAAIRVASRVWLTAGFERTGQARFSSHRGLSERRREIAVGVAYAR